MTLNVDEIRRRVSKHFPQVEQIDSSIIRFVRTAGNSPFAVYYLDLTENLPETPENLTSYQDRVIGAKYFGGRKSLQWSHYLYFITSAARLAHSQAQQAKELIEADRNYARKFVISENELDSVLAPPVVAPAEGPQQPNILSVWTQHLMEAGLHAAILSDDDLPKRLSAIEAASPTPAARRRAPPRRDAFTEVPFIRSFHLKKFRNYPLARRFDFGTVNLICGPNAAGKTSLLEAIELFYCGRSKRNPGPPPPYDLSAVLASGKTEHATSARSADHFRDRNLAWYGQVEIKTHNICSSFARFNFLDTDAAVELSQSTAHIEEDLAKLLIGADASKIWKNIERVHEALPSKLRHLRQLQAQINAELTSLETQLTEATRTTSESDLIRVRLNEMMDRQRWPLPDGAHGKVAAMLVESLTELISLAQHATHLAWPASPISPRELAKYCKNVRAIINKAEPEIARLEGIEKHRQGIVDTVVRHREALRLANEAKRLVDSRVVSRVAERDELRSDVATYVGWIAGFGETIRNALSDIDGDTTLSACQKLAKAKRTQAETRLAGAQSQYAALTQLRDESVRLAQQLREAAFELLKRGANADECPLCHTTFQAGELARHMRRGVDERFDALSKPLLREIRQQQAAARDAAHLASAVEWLCDFCERAKLKSRITVRSALARVDEITKALEQARHKLASADKDIRSLETQGLSIEQFEKASTRLTNLGYPLAERSESALNRLLSEIVQNISRAEKELAAADRQTEKLRKVLAEVLELEEVSVQKLKRALSTLKERLTTVESLDARLGRFLSSYPWPAEKPLGELAVAAESVRKVAANLQAALNAETSAKATYKEAGKRRDALKKQAADLAPRIKRYSAAYSALGHLIRNHSLSSGMDSTLRQYRTAVESIFLRIHSPAEFAGLGSTFSTLRRKLDGTEAKLSEVSTGQRAAFGLSIFLAQNSQLKLAPPVLLIDDPIAHVDDLNSLSFLDYLREIALTGKRQVFFATANDKLATLFERKFDFMGEAFRRFDLSRKA